MADIVLNRAAAALQRIMGVAVATGDIEAVKETVADELEDVRHGDAQVISSQTDWSPPLSESPFESEGGGEE